MIDAIEAQGIQDHLALFTQQRPLYVRFTGFLQATIASGLNALGIEADIKARTKSVFSFAEKVLRKKYAAPMEQMTDLTGVRIITHTRAEVHKVCLFIRKHF